MKLSKEKLLGSYREGLGIELGLGIVIAELNLTPCFGKRQYYGYGGRVSIVWALVARRPGA